MAPKARLAELGIQLPDAPASVANYVPCIQTGNLVMTAGQLPFVAGQVVLPGKVGGELTSEQGAEAAKIAVINGLAQIDALVGDLSRVVRVLRVEGFVQSVVASSCKEVVNAGKASRTLRNSGSPGAAKELSINR